jgi:hypothetical protein
VTTVTALARPRPSARAIGHLTSHHAPQHFTAVPPLIARPAYDLLPFAPFAVSRAYPRQSGFRLRISQSDGSRLFREDAT